MQFSRLMYLKFIGLFVGFAAKFVTGSIFVFNVYQDAIKVTFNYTQKEVEVLSSLLNVGLGFGFLPGMFYDRFGPTWASGAGLIVSVSSFLLIWSTTKYPSFYSTKSWLMSIYFFLCGLGSVFTYMVALNTNVINFSEKHTGKVVGFLNAFFAGSPSVFAVVYYNIFTTGDATVVENQDFPGFMLMHAILFAIVDLFCMLFLRIFKETDEVTNIVAMKYTTDHITCVQANGNAIKSSDSDETSFEMPITSNNRITGQVNKGFDGRENDKPQTVEQLEAAIKKHAAPKEGTTGQHLPLGKLLCDPNYHSFALMFALASCVGLVYVTNITVASKSVGLDDFNNKLVIIIPITNAIVSAIVGIVSDRFKEKVPRMGLAVVGCSSFVVSLILVVLLVETLSCFVVATVFSGIGIGMIWSLSPTIMKEMFFVGNLGRNWGIALLFASLLGLASQAGFGELYDMRTPEGDLFCFGIECVRGGFAVFLGVAVLSVMVGVLILFKQKCYDRWNRFKLKV